MASQRDTEAVHRMSRASRVSLSPQRNHHPSPSSSATSYTASRVSVPPTNNSAMDQIIDMTTANPYATDDNGISNKKHPVPTGAAPRGMAVTFSASTLATMQALAANTRSRQQLQKQQQLPEQEPYEDDMDQTMKSAGSLMSDKSLMSGVSLSIYSAMNQDDDYSSSSSWSDSDEEGDDNAEYVMYAPTANSSRGHLLRPLSVDQITALAVATGARKKPSKPLPKNQSLSSLAHNSAHCRSGTRVAALPRSKPQPQTPPFHNTNNSLVGGHRSMSMPDIAPQLEHYRQMKAALSTTTATKNKGDSGKSSSAVAAPVKPDDRLKAILQEQGRTIDYCSYSSLQNYFLKVEPKHIEAFKQDVINEIRGKSVEGLQALQKQGKMLQCCNKFGESIVHMTCRQSSAQVLEYLMGNEANVNIRVCCDSGRTPLHDACWTSKPDFSIIRMLLKECPDFLRIKDKRGFSPLAYVPHGQWGAWGDFLEKNKDLLGFSTLD